MLDEKILYKVSLLGVLAFSSLDSTAAILRIYPAVELQFTTDAGKYYQIESSSNLVNWTATGSLIIGTGSDFNLLVSTKDTNHRFFRSQEVDATPGLVAFYRFDGSATDSSTNGNHGIPSNITSTTNRFGRLNAAYQFSGAVGSFVRVPHSPSLDITKSITLAAWINFEVGGSSSPRIINKSVYDLSTATASQAIRTIGFTIKESGESLLLTPTQVAHAGKWHFAAGTFDGSLMRIYLDAELVAEREAPAGIRANDLDVNIGMNTDNGDDRYKGIIDDAQIYNRALTIEEIRALFNKAD